MGQAIPTVLHRAIASKTSDSETCPSSTGHAPVTFMIHNTVSGMT